jgi:hypothetical protein
VVDHAAVLGEPLRTICAILSLSFDEENFHSCSAAAANRRLPPLAAQPVISCKAM